MAGCGPSEVGLARRQGRCASASGHLEGTPSWQPQALGLGFQPAGNLIHLGLKFFSLEGWEKSMNLRLSSNGLLLASHHHDTWTACGREKGGRPRKAAFAQTPPESSYTVGDPAEQPAFFSKM